MNHAFCNSSNFQCSTLQNVDFTSVFRISRLTQKNGGPPSMHNTQKKWCSRHTCLSYKLYFNYPCMLLVKLVLHEVEQPFTRSLTAELNLFLEVVFSNILDICSRPISTFLRSEFMAKKKKKKNASCFFDL